MITLLTTHYTITHTYHLNRLLPLSFFPSLFFQILLTMSYIRSYSQNLILLALKSYLKTYSRVLRSHLKYIPLFFSIKIIITLKAFYSITIMLLQFLLSLINLILFASPYKQHSIPILLFQPGSNANFSFLNIQREF